MTLKEVHYLNKTNKDIKEFNLETIKKNPHILFPNYTPELNQALKILKDNEIITKYRLNNHLNLDNEKKLDVLEKEIKQKNLPKYYGIYLTQSFLVAVLIAVTIFTLILFTSLIIIGKINTSEYLNDYKLWLNSLFILGIFANLYFSHKKIIQKNKKLYENEIAKLQDSIDYNNRENSIYAKEYNKIMSSVIKDDNFININHYLKHCYQTNIEKLQENNFEIIDEMYRKDIKITNNIEDLEYSFTILPHDNWIISEINKSIIKQEYSDIGKAILASTNVTV